MFRELTRHDPGAPAVADDGGAWTFGALRSRAEEVGRWLAAERPRLVWAELPSGRAFTALQLGALAAGAVFLPVPPALRPAERARLAALVTPDVVVGDLALAGVPHVTPAALLEGPAPLPRPRGTQLPERTRHVQLTSGSTGAPKLLLLDEDALRANVEACRGTIGPGPVASVVPQFHALGNAVVVEHLAAGVGVHLSDGLAPGRTLAGARHLVATPGFVRLLLGFSVGWPAALAELTLGGEPTDATLVAALRAAIPGLTVHVRYGLAECVGPLCRHTIGPDDPLPPPGAVGRGLDGVVLAVVDGELVARTPTAAFAQWGPAGAEVLGGAHGMPTGDEATLGADGGVTLQGRRSTFVKTLGHRVSPLEVEEVLRAGAGVADAAVVGVPDVLAGERLAAWVEPASGAALEPGSLAAACRGSLSAHKVPRRWRVAPLPRTPSGKVDRAAVAAALRAQVVPNQK